MLASKSLIAALALLAQDPRADDGDRLTFAAPVGAELDAGAAGVKSPGLAALFLEGAAVGRRYRLDVPAAQQVTLTLTARLFDAYLIVRDQDGEVVAENDDGPLAEHAQVTLTADGPITWTVDACSRDGRLGPFELTATVGAAAPLAANAAARDAAATYRARKQALGGDDPSTLLARAAVVYQRGRKLPGMMSVSATLGYVDALRQMGKQARVARLLDGPLEWLMGVDADKSVDAQAAISIGPRVAQLLFDVGRRGDAIAALDCLRDLLQGRPPEHVATMASFVLSIAELELARGRPDRARELAEHVERAVRQAAPDDGDLLLSVRFDWANAVSRVTGEGAMAQQVAGEILAAADNDESRAIRRAQLALYRALADLRGACEDVRRALEYYVAERPGSPEEAYLRHLYGILVSRVGSPEEGIAQKRRAMEIVAQLRASGRLQLVPPSVDPMAGLAAFTAEGWRPRAGLDAFGEVLQQPEPFSIAMSLADDLASMDRPREAVEVVRAAIAQAGEDNQLQEVSLFARSRLIDFLLAADAPADARSAIEAQCAEIVRRLRAGAFRDWLALGRLANGMLDAVPVVLSAAEAAALFDAMYTAGREVAGDTVSERAALRALRLSFVRVAPADDRSTAYWREIVARVDEELAGLPGAELLLRKGWLRSVGEVALAREEYSVAARAFARAREAWEQVEGLALDVVRLRLQLGFALSRDGRHEDAWRETRLACDELRGFVSAELAGVDEARALVYAGVLNDFMTQLLLVMRGDDAEQIQFTARFAAWRSGLVYRQLRARRSIIQSGAIAEVEGLRREFAAARAAAQKAILAPPTAASERELSTRLRELRQRRQDAEQALVRTVARRTEVAPAPLEQPERTAVMWFAAPPAGSRAVAFLLIKEGGILKTIEMGEQWPLYSPGTRPGAAATGTKRGRDDEVGESDRLARIARALAPSLLPLVGEVDRLLLLTDGPFVDVPFAELQLQTGRFLVEDFELVHVLDLQSAGAVGAAGAPIEDVLLFGDVDYGASAGDDGLAPLPATGAELDGVARAWGDHVDASLRGGAATKEALLAKLPQFDALHLATHGRRLPTMVVEHLSGRAASLAQEIVDKTLPGNLVGVACARANEAPAAWLTAEEVGWLPLGDCRLVVLSACDTAVGQRRAGEGAMSLQRAFLVAGAETVISAVRPVDDEATSRLMQRFYVHLAESGVPARAWRQTQLEAIARARKEGRADRHWSAFQVAGGWR